MPSTNTASTGTTMPTIHEAAPVAQVRKTAGEHINPSPSSHRDRATSIDIAARRAAARSKVMCDVTLSAGARTFYNLIDDYAGMKGIAWPRQGTIALRLEVSRRTVNRWVAECIRTGYIQTEGRRNATKYRLTWAQPLRQECLITYDKNVSTRTLPGTSEASSTVSSSPSGGSSEPTVKPISVSLRENREAEPGSCSFAFTDADGTDENRETENRGTEAESLEGKSAEAEPGKPEPAGETRPPTPEASSEPRAKPWSKRELARVRSEVTAFFGKEPSEGFETSIMLAARGKSAAEVLGVMKSKWANPACQPGGKWAPRREAWFLTVVEDELFPGHLSEVPAKCEYKPSAEDLARGIDALEVPDVTRPAVENPPAPEVSAPQCPPAKAAHSTCPHCSGHGVRGWERVMESPPNTWAGVRIALETGAELCPCDAGELWRDWAAPASTIAAGGAA